MAKSKETSLKRICLCPDCDKMKAYQPASNFYKTRSSSMPFHPYCKDCVDKIIDNGDVNSLYDVFKTLNYPLIMNLWDEVCQKNSVRRIGNYLKRVGLNSKYKDFTWDDSILEISEDKELSEETQKYFEETPQWDEVWQGNYTKKELDYLNEYYNDLDKDFKIVTRNHKDYARKIAQASLVVNNSYNAMRANPEDKEAITAYKTATSNFDMLSKSAQFAESQRGANDVSLGCFGRVFEAVEKHNWVPEHVPDNQDLYDKIIQQFANIKKSL